MTQCEQIYEHMATIGPITTMDAIQLYGITRLASRINDLRKYGFKIKVETKSNAKTHWAEYSLEEG